MLLAIAVNIEEGMDRYMSWCWGRKSGPLFEVEQGGGAARSNGKRGKKLGFCS